MENLHALEGITDEGDGTGLREMILLYLRGKVLPELEADLDLPLFVGVQGGANTGKSTVFNALAGQILSPAVIQASATKHPLVWAHECWRARLLTENRLHGFDGRELGDPKELIVDADRTELLYFRFHADDALAGIALIDSPDFDSALATNPRVARRIAVLSDLTLFVTTAQKYRDRELVEHLRRLRELKASVLILFNMVDEEIVFETLAEDLRVTVPLEAAEYRTLRVPHSRARHPEEELRDPLRREVLDVFRQHRAEEVKPQIVHRTCRKVLGHVREMCRRLSGQLEVEEALERHMAAGLEGAVASYARSFSLALPEETLAVRKVIRHTEAWRLLELPEDLRNSSKVLGALGFALGRLNETIRRFLLLLSIRDEGTIDDTPEVVAEYARGRNETDLAEVLRGSESLRRSGESFLRDRENTSPLARAVLRREFAPECSTGFAGRVRKEFERELVDREGAERILEEVDGWLERHPHQRRALAAGTVALKIAAGISLARVLPPDGLLSLPNLLYFAAGYLLAAYLVALVTSLVLRRKRRFRRNRIEGMRAVLECAVTGPLREAANSALRQEDLAALEIAARSVENHLDSTAVAGREVPAGESMSP